MDIVNRNINQKTKVVEEGVKSGGDAARKLGAAAFSSSSAVPLTLGVLNGMADVFANASMPDNCRKNVSATYNTINTLFVNWAYSFPTDLELFFTDIGNLMTYPYGLSFNCYYAANSVFFSKPSNTGQSFAGALVIVN